MVVARPRGNPKCDGASRPTRRGTGCPFGTVVLVALDRMPPRCPRRRRVNRHHRRRCCGYCCGFSTCFHHHRDLRKKKRLVGFHFCFCMQASEYSGMCMYCMLRSLPRRSFTTHHQRLASVLKPAQQKSCHSQHRETDVSTSFFFWSHDSRL